MFTSARAIVLLCLSLLVSSCNQNSETLTAVQKMVQTTDAAAPSYAAIAADYAASCHRTNRWIVTGNLAVPASGLDSCAGADRVTQDWQKLNVMVINYIDALGGLAGSGQTSSTYGFDKLAVSLQTSKILTQSQASTIQQLATSVVTDIFNGQRADAIVKYASQSNAYLDRVIQRLEAAADDYRILLAVEGQTACDFYKQTIPTTDANRRQCALSVTQPVEAALPAADGFAAPGCATSASATSSDDSPRTEPLNLVGYTDIPQHKKPEAKEGSQKTGPHKGQATEPPRPNSNRTNTAKPNTASSDSGTLFERRQWNSDLSDLQTKIAAIEQYKASLEALYVAHNALVTQANNPNPSITSIVDAYSAQFLPQIQAIQEAFSKK